MFSPLASSHSKMLIVDVPSFGISVATSALVIIGLSPLLQIRYLCLSGFLGFDNIFLISFGSLEVLIYNYIPLLSHLFRISQNTICRRIFFSFQN